VLLFIYFVLLFSTLFQLLVFSVYLHKNLSIDLPTVSLFDFSFILQANQFDHHRLQPCKHIFLTFFLISSVYTSTIYNFSLFIIIHVFILQTLEYRGKNSTGDLIFRIFIFGVPTAASIVPQIPNSHHRSQHISMPFQRRQP